MARAFGDIGAKLPSLQGNPKVIIATPEIKKIRITDEADFIVMACDGVYDTMSSKEVISTVWSAARKEFKKGKSIHEICGCCAEQVLKTAMEKNSLDNVTVIIIAFDNFGRTLEKEKECEMLIKQKITMGSRNENRPLLFLNRASSNSSLKTDAKDQKVVHQKTISNLLKSLGCTPKTDPKKESKHREVYSPLITQGKTYSVNFQRIKICLE